MKEHEINDKGLFICGWYLENKNVCDKIIKYFDSAEGKTPGRVNLNGNHFVDHKIKHSEDIAAWPDDLHLEYCYALKTVMDKYIEKFPACAQGPFFAVTSPINIQHYPPAGGYFAWHMERSGTDEPFVSRHLVFMTYLNDIEEGGQTEFYHQGIAIKPERGLTLMWPSDWTHYHRGVAAPNEDKYIVTGWFNYIKN